MTLDIGDVPVDADGRPDTAAAWEAILPRVRRLQRRHPRLDIEGAAALHLCRALRLYRPGEGTSFASYFVASLRHLPMIALRQERPAGCKGDGRHLPPMGQLDFEPAAPPYRPDESGVLEAWQALYAEDRLAAETLREWAIEGRSLREIARRRGQTVGAVRWALIRARRELRRRLTTSFAIG